VNILFIPCLILALLRSRFLLLSVSLLAIVLAESAHAQSQVDTGCSPDGGFTLASVAGALPIYVAPQSPDTVRLAVTAFAGDVEKVTGRRPAILDSLDDLKHAHEAVLVGVLGSSPPIDALVRVGKLDVSAVRGKWESAAIMVVDHPTPALGRALLIAGSDRRGTAYALFSISREIGVSPWNWWADVPVLRRNTACLASRTRLIGEPSVRYRGIFLNDEDWGLRPWAAKQMDPDLNNIGPHTYERIFELLLRLRANTLWPAMHPGTLPFNAAPENARLADRWGIVMGSSHSEALLRNNVGEWDEKRDGAWNYQTNRAAIDRYWSKRLSENGRFENFYTVGMRGVHDTGLEAEGSAEVKARLVEHVMDAQRRMLREQVASDLDHIPQVIWLYKESLELYRAGMRVPDDVTLGWTDDNYGYLRQLPTAEEQQRQGGSAVYFHVSYWGFPHDYLWLCTTPLALIREEMTKAFEHNARRLWILNVGDLKPAEADIDYFLQLAWDEPHTAALEPRDFLRQWFAEQFPTGDATVIVGIMTEYYRLNFIRKPEFMGFNGYNDGIRRTAFNPLAWGDENMQRIEKWNRLEEEASKVGNTLPPSDRDAWFELVGYPVEAAAAQNLKFLWTDRSYLDAATGRINSLGEDAARALAAHNRIQSLTTEYIGLAGGKWKGMMDSSPRQREVFKMPEVASSARVNALPEAWSAGKATTSMALSDPNLPFGEQAATVSINAAHFARSQGAEYGRWKVLRDLGISGDSIELDNAEVPPTAYAAPSAWLDYDFKTTSDADANLSIYLLPTFPIDSVHRLRFTITLDNKFVRTADLAEQGEWKENSAPQWEANVLRNAAIVTANVGHLRPGRHTLRLEPMDPGLVFEHLSITFPGAPQAYPVPPETR
jgi:Glycosyl hydrolase family 115/Gylcosyl hydrolase family 115 C-terminal domain